MSVGNRWSISTRFAVEGQLGAWPGNSRHNSILGYGAPSPTLPPVDRHSPPRWVEVFSAGPQDTTFKVLVDCDWLQAFPSKGSITRDGLADTRVYLGVDWTKIPQGCQTEGHARFVASDGAAMTVTVPTRLGALEPPASFRGFIEADSYVAIEAVHFQSLRTCGSHQWQKLAAYGRTLSAMAVYPLTQTRLESDAQPGIQYLFWLGAPVQGDTIQVTLHLGPSLNYVLGKPFTWRVQLDDREPIVVQPIPSTEPGSLPDDWEEVVAQEVRITEVSLPAQGLEAGAHSLVIWAESTGLVLERVIIHREKLSDSYLGPQESFRQE